MARPFAPGQPIVLREIWQGRVWSARPSIVVADSSELIACYIAPGSLWVRARSATGEKARPTQGAQVGWVLQDTVWEDVKLLRLSVPHQRHSVLIFWNPDGSVRRWYINLEEPLRRTSLGFDFSDQILDVIATPDLSSWHWDDEDELAEAVAAGLVTKEKAAELYADGRAAVAELQSGRSVFNGWADWRPDPSWPVPVLPEGWDTV